MKKLMTTAGLATCALAMAALPDASFARTRHHHHYRHSYQYSRSTYASDCEARRHRNARTGTVVGALAGGLLGNQVAGHGSRTAGTLIGAGAGAVVGHHITQREYRCR